MIAGEDRRDDRDDADEHHDALDEVVHDRGHVAADHNVDARHHCHSDDAHVVGQPERHPEQARQAVVDRCRVGDEEDEDDGRRRDAQRLGLVAQSEELRHRLGAQAVRHLARARAEHPPSQKRAQDGVAYACPHGGDAVLEAELAGVADEHDSREVAGPVGERAHPRADVAAAQHEPVDGGRRFAAVDAHAHGHADEDEHHAYFFDHERYSYPEGRPAAAVADTLDADGARARGSRQPGGCGGAHDLGLRRAELYATRMHGSITGKPMCYRYR